MPLSNRERYLFDLEGYVVVRDILDPEMVRRLNEAIDANPASRREESGGSVQSAPLMGDPRGIYEGMLTWPKPWCEPFRELLVHPPLIGHLNEMLGRGWHMDHPPTVFESTKGAEGLLIHLGGAHFYGGAYYQYGNGQMRNGLTVVQYLLADVNEGDGGFCCIPGSHKSNYIRPTEMSLLQLDVDKVVQPSAKAGDAIIFTEALAHGTKPWTAPHDRRALLMRYSPKWVMYGPGFHTYSFPEWVDELTEVQRAVLEPAYFYNRALITDDGTSIVRPNVDPDEPNYRYLHNPSLHYDGPAPLNAESPS